MDFGGPESEDELIETYVNGNFAVLTYRELDKPMYPCRIVAGFGVATRLGFAASQNSSLLPLLNSHLQKMQQSGLIQSLHKKHALVIGTTPDFEVCEDSETGGLGGLGYEAIATAFIVLGAGGVGAMVSVIIEDCIQSCSPLGL